MRCGIYAKQVCKVSQVTQRMERKPASTKTLEFNFSWFSRDACFWKWHVVILNIRDDPSRFGVFIPVKKMTAAQTAFHLLYNVILKFGKAESICSGFVGEMVAGWKHPQGNQWSISSSIHGSSRESKSDCSSYVKRFTICSVFLQRYASSNVHGRVFFGDCLWISSRRPSFWSTCFINSSTFRRWNHWVCWKKKRSLRGHVWNHRRWQLQKAGSTMVTTNDLWDSNCWRVSYRYLGFSLTCIPRQNLQMLSLDFMVLSLSSRSWTKVLW